MNLILNGQKLENSISDLDIAKMYLINPVNIKDMTGQQVIDNINKPFFIIGTMTHDSIPIKFHGYCLVYFDEGNGSAYYATITDYPQAYLIFTKNKSYALMGVSVRVSRWKYDSNNGTYSGLPRTIYDVANNIADKSLKLDELCKFYDSKIQYDGNFEIYVDC